MSNIQKKEKVVTLVPQANQLPTPAKLAITAAGGGMAIAALAGAAIALFQISMTIMTIVAIGVALVATIILLPALQMALATQKLRAMEAVARANPIQTLILKRQELGRVSERKAAELQNAAGLISNFEQQLRAAAGSLSPEEMAAEQADLQRSREALESARSLLAKLDQDMRDFDAQIERAKLKDKLAQAKGSIAQALGEAQLSPEQQHITETALSEIAQRAGRNAEALDQALAAAGRRVAA